MIPSDHTPTPWKTAKKSVITDGDSTFLRYIAHCQGGGNQNKRALADAEFICLAVNNHERLVRLLASAEDEIDRLRKERGLKNHEISAAINSIRDKVQILCPEHQSLRSRINEGLVSYLKDNNLKIDNL